MGARKEKRDLDHFRKSLDLEQEEGREQREIREIMSSFQNDARNSFSLRIELDKARALIERLRAENQVLKDERKRFIEVVENCKRHITIVGNPLKKYAVALVKSQLQKASLI